MNYPVRWLQRFLPRTVAVVLGFLVSLLIIIALAATLGLAILSQRQQLMNRFLEIANSIGFLLEQLEAFLQTRNLQLDLDAIAERIRSFALSGINYIIVFLWSSLTNFITMDVRQPHAMVNHKCAIENWEGRIHGFPVALDTNLRSVSFPFGNLIDEPAQYLLWL